MLCWFNCFPVAVFHPLFLRHLQVLNVSTDQSDLLYRTSYRNLCSSPSKSRLHLSTAGIPWKMRPVEVSNKLFRNWVFKSTALYWVDLSKLVLKAVPQWCSAISFYTWWETVLNILGGPHCSGTALCHVGSTSLFRAGGKVSDGCWWDPLWMCLLHLRNKKSHSPPVLETLLIYKCFW